MWRDGSGLISTGTALFSGSIYGIMPELKAFLRRQLAF